MIIDKRQEVLAHNLVNYSIHVGKGDKVWIDAIGCGEQLPACIIREVYKNGGIPFLNIIDKRLEKEILKGATAEMLDMWAKRDADFMDKMDCYIGIRGGDNSYELCDLPESIMQEYDKRYGIPVHSDRRVAHTRWVILRYPTPSMSQLAGMSTEAFEDYFFDVCCLDYQKMSNAMNPLVDLMNRTDKVRIVAKDTDLTFSIKGIPAIKCDGACNIPDGEVYTAPVKDSVNGTLTYNVPTMYNGTRFDNVCLKFNDGKIIEATCLNNSKKLNEIFDTDEGARYVGEFSFGLNPYILEPMMDILFDEKIAGSFHFTPGSCYNDAYNGNDSAIHWDMVQIQRDDYGGGEIWFDGVLVRKNGLFVLPELECLNPENLK